MVKKILRYKLALLAFAGLFVWSGVILAQELPFFARNFQAIDREIKVGDIVSKNEDGVFRSHIPYDESVVGVVTARKKPILVFGKFSSDTVAVVLSGKALVKVDSALGKIKKGDFIASSDKPGVGQRASQSGYVIGRSLEDFDGGKGLIRAEVNIQYLSNIDNIGHSSIRKIINAIGEQAGRPENFPTVLRYTFALLSGGGSLLLGFFLLGRVLRTGVEAVGRNPLAKKSIILTVVFNLVGIVVIVLVGFGLALLAIFFKTGF